MNASTKHVYCTCSGSTIAVGRHIFLPRPKMYVRFKENWGWISGDCFWTFSNFEPVKHIHGKNVSKPAVPPWISAANSWNWFGPYKTIKLQHTGAKRTTGRGSEPRTWIAACRSHSVHAGSLGDISQKARDKDFGNVQNWNVRKYFKIYRCETMP